MNFVDTTVEGAKLVELEPISDERGFFARAWCRVEFAAAGLQTTWAQENVTYNPRRGTLRGLHLQRPPHQEAKLVRCTRGAVWDVVADLRPASPSYRRSFGVELTAEDRRMLFVPEGCAHGYLTLVDDAEVRYLTSAEYAPDAATGVRYDDPALRIDWPEPVRVVSGADRGWPLLRDEESER